MSHSLASPLVVAVDLGVRSYDILIGPGLIGQAGAHIARLAPGAACAVVTDANVAAHALPQLTDSLERAGIRHSVVTVAPGEGSKSFAAYVALCDAILARRLERRDLIVALGGGVVGDLAGFAAATVKRGMRLVQVPTSLLAQVDSSVGGKTGINSPHGKNLVGAFHQPSLVLCDTLALDTLPPREFRAGYAELVKYGLIDDEPFFAQLERTRSEVFSGGPARVEAIARACRAKADVVSRDEREEGERALLNLGHTFGHALERLVGYDGARLVHGEAVAIGLCLAFRFSAARGLCPSADADRVAAHLAAAGLPTRIGEIPGWTDGSGAVLDAMMGDKKVTGGRLNLILAHGIGESFIAADVPTDAVRAFLDGALAGT